jgi:putative membrane protein insertion efficiency factor
MGHSDSSAHVSGYGGVCGGDERVAEALAEARRDNLKGDSLRETLRSAGKWILLLLVRMYQVFLSPFFGGACKFYPSCSRYGYEAIAKHGAWRGSVLAVKRLLRCRPFTKGGFDPVPDVEGDFGREYLQGLKPHRTPIVDVAAEAATYKDRGKSFEDSTQGKPFAHGTQGKQEFAQ